MTTRRQFLTQLGAAAATAFIATKLPLSLLPSKARKRVATEFLNHWWNDRVRAGLPMPQEMLVGSALFDAYGSEVLVMTRFSELASASTKPGLKFKSITLRPAAFLRGWDMAWLGPGSMVTMPTTEIFWRNRNEA